jgi:hypothetical protein
MCVGVIIAHSAVHGARLSEYDRNLIRRVDIFAWLSTLSGLLFGAARWQTRRRFPNPLSVLWLPILLAFAFLPPVVVYGVAHLWSDPNNQAWIVPF